VSVLMEVVVVHAPLSGTTLRDSHPGNTLDVNIFGGLSTRTLFHRTKKRKKMNREDGVWNVMRQAGLKWSDSNLGI